MYKPEVNDVERGVALRMPLPNLDIVGYRVKFNAQLSDGTTAEVQQFRNSKCTEHDEAVCLYREAEQLQGLCDWLQEQLAAATGAMRFSHHYLKTLGASLEQEGVFVNAETFDADNRRAKFIEQRFLQMLQDAEQQGRGFNLALTNAVDTYAALTGRDPDPLILMAMTRVVHSSLITFLDAWLPK